MSAVERKLGDFASALDDAGRAAKTAGSDARMAAQAHLVRGVLLEQSARGSGDKKLGNAEAEYREALALEPQELTGHYNLGINLLRQKRDAEGIAELKKFVDADEADERLAEKARRIIAEPVRATQPFAPDFSFVTPEGESFSNETLRGKVVLLDFWGSWCPPCRESVPTLARLHKKFVGKPFVMVGVSSDDDEEAWKAFIAAHHMDWPDYLDSSGEVQSQFEIDGFPTFVVLDRDGIIQFRFTGLDSMTGLEIEEAISKSLKKPYPSPALASSKVDSGSAAANATLVRAEVARNTVDSHSSASLLDSGSVTGNTYRNPQLGLSYQFPASWVPASPEASQSAGAQPTGQPAGLVLFQAAAGNAAGDAASAAPFVGIAAAPWANPPLTLAAFSKMIAGEEAAGKVRLGAIEEFTLGNHRCFRATLATAKTDPRLYISRTATTASGHLITVEFHASTRQELESLLGTLQSLVLSAP
jgi:thiol-disulfide isomerase/thioredoxin